MGKITFILGGSRSGKSTYALEIAKKYKSVAFIATAQALDNEMFRRIKLHKATRPKHWQTFEEPKDITLVLEKSGSKFACIIIDCLTLWVSNLLLTDYKPQSIENQIKKIVLLLRKIKTHTIIVSNEVGLGIVPNNKLGRVFCDVAGIVNQIVAKEADEVFFMISGIPTKIKEVNNDE